ncbi:membrane protein [Pseudovibrio japonicus]|uniref:Lectin-like protein BA14k n=1 Tax=Pseudovibrio japonicus TaxID=366534 RepID=A0ABQ3EA14_9HYPH|nr:BA14K family protein [Pseudovibrio japonicus]GHB31228.1 membrane protein [Pseudovibrio japonicus]
MAKASAIISVALAGAMMLPVVSAAQAGQKRNTYIENNTYVQNHYYKKNKRKARKHKKSGINGGQAAAIGVMGLATGLIIGNAVKPRPQYIAPPPPAYRPPVPAYRPPVVVHQPAPVYRAPVAAPAPWSPAWYSYCTSKYRSFNPSTGTYRTYSGKDRFCQ